MNRTGSPADRAGKDIARWHSQLRRLRLLIPGSRFLQLWKRKSSGSLSRPGSSPRVIATRPAAPFTSRALAGVSAYRRQVRRPHSGSHRSAIAGVRRRQLCDRRRRPLDSAAAQRRRLWSTGRARAHRAPACGTHARAASTRLSLRSSIPATPSTPSSSATATSLPGPLHWRSPSILPGPIIRSFFYGGVGMGKSHLMHAIGHEVKRRQPSASICYLSAQSLPTT